MSLTQHVLGLDVGSVAVGFVVVAGDGAIADSGYVFHKGDVHAAIHNLLQDIDWQSCSHVAATATVPSWVMAQTRYNNQVATIKAAKTLFPDVRGLLNVGGEKFSLDIFDDSGHFLGAKTNTSCAAGTGSFLDQQAGRLNLRSSHELSIIADQSTGECPQIASRCAVFAKTDLIHAQQEGYQLEEISNGLCRGLAKNIIDTLFAGNSVPAGRLIFCGGVSKNAAVVKHVEKMLQRDVTIPDNGEIFGALGAALLLIDDLNQDSSTEGIPPLTLSGVADICSSQSTKQKKYYYPPLRLEYSDYPDFYSLAKYTTSREATGGAVEVDIYEPLTPESSYDVYLGIDIGSTSTKAVLINDSGEVLCGFYTRTAGRPLVAVQSIFSAIHEIEAKNSLQFRVIQNGTTGSGRKFIGSLIGADGIIDEITAHARAAYELNPDVDTIIEIGGQDAKFTTLVNGRVTSSTMNNVCAAGTGSFIEEQAARLGCTITDYADRTDNIRAPMTSDRCTVFMERDINHFLSEGYSVDEVLAAALHSVRENYLLKVATEKNIGKTVFFQGATAKNRGLVAAFEQRLKRPILVSKFCHLTGALGTALIVRDEMKASTAFRGIDLYRQHIPIENEICQLCNNHCKLSVAEINGQRVAYGFLCGRDYETQNFVRKENTSFDLLKERKKLAKFAVQAEQGELTIGIPAALHLVDDLHLWQKFFDTLGIRTITSEKCKSPVKTGKHLAQAEFCAPMTSMYGHVDWLLRRADFVFLPNYLENRAREGRRMYCYYTQFVPALASTVAGNTDARILRPIIRYLYTSFHTKMQLYRMLQKVAPGKFNFFDVSTAYDKAIAFDREYREALQQAYLSRNRAGSDIQVVFVGRPYSLLSPTLNSNIPGIFRDLHIDTFFQDMISYSPDQVASIQPLLEEIHWEHAAKILEVTEAAAQMKGLYPVYVTSFKCAPDSFGVEYFKKIMAQHNKPYLILELDEHDSSVGYETRIEAAVRAFRNHHENLGGQAVSPLRIPYHEVNPDLAERLDRPVVLFPNWDRITCQLLVSTLRREGYDARLLSESEQTIRESLKHNTGQCIPLNGVAQCAMSYVRDHELNPAHCVLWLSESTLACNIRLYPHHIKQIFKETGGGMENIAVCKGDLALTDISLSASRYAYFAYLLGGMLRKIACKIRPYEVEPGLTDRILNKAITLLSDAFEGKRQIDRALDEIVTRFEWIETRQETRPKVAIFGDLYSRDNSVFNQDLIRFIEANGGEVITTPYSEYAKMIATSYFRKWFNEGKYFNLLTNKALLAAMTTLEKRYMKILDRVLGETEHSYSDNPADILAQFNIAPEHNGESMDNILKIHYLLKHYPDICLLVQASPALCCASLVTEAMKSSIEEKTGVPVVSITYDGTGGHKNEIIVPYLKYPQTGCCDGKVQPMTSIASIA